MCHLRSLPPRPHLVKQALVDPGGDPVQEWPMPPEKTLPDLRAMRRRLLQWYRQNRRDLPWRRTKDSYRIWISEVMLQQTRVAAVIPYYRRFVARFPTVLSLARAREPDLLRHWAGLGYYSRARNIHRAAKQIVALHDSCFPVGAEAALALPGVGRYTAAAVLSIAGNLPLAALDGNVARVLARLQALHGDLRLPARWRGLEVSAQALLDRRAPGEWNQAMMELGAMVCTPRAPRCGECPLSADCRAFALGIMDSLPQKRSKRAAVSVRIAAAVLLDSAGRTLLLRNVNGNARELFSNLWQFPAIKIRRNAREELRHHLEVLLGLSQPKLLPLTPVRHAVTYRHITLLPFLLRVARLPKRIAARRSVQTGRAPIRKAEESRTLPPTNASLLLRPLLADVEDAPVSSATRKIARAAAHPLSRL